MSPIGIDHPTRQPIKLSSFYFALIFTQMTAQSCTGNRGRMKGGRGGREEGREEDGRRGGRKGGREAVKHLSSGLTLFLNYDEKW